MDNELKPTYSHNRANAYPSVEEQLDMIWHELKATGSLRSSYVNDAGEDVSGTWFSIINQVKDSNPKPDEMV